MTEREMSIILNWKECPCDHCTKGPCMDGDECDAFNKYYAETHPNPPTLNEPHNKQRFAVFIPTFAYDKNNDKIFLSADHQANEFLKNSNVNVISFQVNMSDVLKRYPYGEPVITILYEEQ